MEPVGDECDGFFAKPQMMHVMLYVELSEPAHCKLIQTSCLGLRHCASLGACCTVPVHGEFGRPWNSTVNETSRHSPQICLPFLSTQNNGYWNAFQLEADQNGVYIGTLQVGPDKLGVWHNRAQCHSLASQSCKEK